MNKQELHEAFSNIHASDALKKQVLSAEMENKKNRNGWVLVRRAVACAAVLALLLTMFFWPGEVETEDGKIIAAPGILRVYATDLENPDLEELEKYELKEGIGGYGSYIPYSNLTRGIPLLFQIPDGYFGEAEVTFSISADYGWFNDGGNGSEKALAVKNGDRVWWTSGALSEVQEIVDENGRFYGYVILYTEDMIVGYGVIDFYYFQPEDDVPPVFSAIGFSTVCFPLVDGKFQNVTEEYVWEQIEEYKRMKVDEEVVFQWADKE